MSKNTHLLSPGGSKGYKYSPQFSKMGKILILCPFGPFQISNIHKTHLKRRLINISSKLIKKQRGISQYIVTRGVKTPNFDQKIPQMLVLMQITSKFGQFYNENQSYQSFQMKYGSISSKLITTQQGVSLYGVTPGGQTPQILYKNGSQILVKCK